MQRIRAPPLAGNRNKLFPFSRRGLREKTRHPTPGLETKGVGHRIPKTPSLQGVAMTFHTCSAATAAAHSYDDGGPEDHDIRPTDRRLGGILGTLADELAGLTPDVAAEIAEHEMRAIHKARNVLKTARRNRARREARRAEPDREPEADPADPVLPLRFGKATMKRYRSLLVKTCPKCAFCGRTLTDETATLDHLHPKARGGENRPHNLALACGPCNTAKGGRTVAEWAHDIVSAANDPTQFDALLARLVARDAG